MARVLIIDDEEAILKMYGAALSEYDILTAKDGEEGLKIAVNESPDLILLDIILPKVNGLDVLEKLKNDKDTCNVPILILTNLPKEASADKAKALGADGYFVKADYEPDKLASEVDKLLRGKGVEATETAEE